MKSSLRKKANLAFFLRISPPPYSSRPAAMLFITAERDEYVSRPYPPAAIFRQIARAISRVPTAVGSSRLAFIS